MSIDHCGQQRDTLLRRYVRETNQSSMCAVMQIYQLPKVGIDRYHDSVLRFCQFQQGPVSRIRTEGSGFEHVMAVVAEPLS